MLVEAIFGIIAISVVFCCCTLCCYILSHFLFTEGKGDEEKPEPEPWEATHYYDPLPLSTPSPPDTIFKPTPYTFKLQNGNGVYSTTVPHAVINPAVLQYPPGHVLDQQRVPPPPAQMKIFSTREIRRRSVRSRSPSPNVRRSKNVWSTNVDLQQPSYNDFKHYPKNQQPHSHSHSQPEQQQQQHHHQQHHDHHYIRYPPEFQQLQEQYQYYSSQDKQQQSRSRQSRQLEELHEQPRRSSRPFVVTTHPTNHAYTNHHQHRYKSRLKEEIT